MKKLAIALSCAILLCLAALLAQAIKIRNLEATIASLSQSLAEAKTVSGSAATRSSLAGQDKGAKLRNALRTGDLRAIRQILDENPELLNAPVGGLGGSPLLSAAYNGKTSVVKELLQRKANLNSQDDHGSTALHNAVHAGHLDVLLLLLEAHADTTVVDNNGQTPLQLAVSKNRPEFAEALREHRAQRPSPPLAPLR